MRLIICYIKTNVLKYFSQAHIKKYKYRYAAVLILLIAAVVSAAFYARNGKNKEIPYNEFAQMVYDGQVKTVKLTEGEKLSFTLNGSAVQYTTDNPRSENFKEMLLLNGVSVSEGNGSNSFSGVIVTVLIIGAALIVLRQKGGIGAQKAMALASKPVESSGIRFCDIAGNDEAKDSVADIVDFISHPEKYKKYGAKMPRGIILYGHPGTGKTLLAKAIATEARVDFFAVSGSDFVQMYVGVGAMRVRELFKKARTKGKAVIFIDEIDALAKKRQSATNGGNDERDQTLNALLTEMSGFEANNGIVVIAATNRLDTLDEALLRPGRFDRQIEVGLPDVNARTRILEYYAKDKPVADEVDIRGIAKSAVYFSGAMLESLMNESAIYAAKENSDKITQRHIDRAVYAQMAGEEKSDRGGLRERDRLITANHEAGHALYTKLMLPEDNVAKITIIPSVRGAGGYCASVPKNDNDEADRLYYTKNELERRIMQCLAGRAAEEIVFGAEDITTGAQNDIDKATRMIRDYIMKYGMGQKTGLLNLSYFSENGAFEECKTAIRELYDKTVSVLSDNIELLQHIAAELMEKESLNDGDLDRLMGECVKMTG